MFRRFSLLDSSPPASKISATPNRLIPLIIKQSKSGPVLESPQKSPQFTFGASSIFNYGCRSLPIGSISPPPSPPSTSSSTSPWFSRLRNSFRKSLLRRAYSLHKDKSSNVKIKFFFFYSIY